MSSHSLMTFAVKLQTMSTTLQQRQAYLFSTDKSSIDLRIDKKEFDIFTEDCTCIIDEVEFVKIIDLETNMSLPVVDTPQATANATPRKGISKFVSRLFNRMAVLPLTLPLCLVLVLGMGNVWGQLVTYTPTSRAVLPTNTKSPTTNITAGNITTGGGISAGTCTSGNFFHGSDVQTNSTSNAATGGDYYEFTVAANSGYTATYTTVSLASLRNSTSTAVPLLKFSYKIGSGSFNDDASSASGGTGNCSSTGNTYTYNFTDFTTSQTVTFRIYIYNGSAASNSFRFGTITVGGSITASPTISTSGTLSAVNTTYGTASASPTSFTVSGSALNGTTAVTVTPPAGFEVATSSDFSTTIGTSASALSLGTASSIASTTIYVRLAATASVSGSPYSGNIVVAGGGATSQNVATVSSTVSKKALTITAGNQSVAYGTAVATVTGNGSYTPTGFVNSETSSVIGGSATFTTTYTTTTNAGSDVATITPVTTNLTATNYSFTAANGNISVTAVVPSAPSITGITPGNTQLSVAFSAPSSNGGASITNYEYSINGGGNWTTPSPAVTTSPFTISGLTNGLTYDVQIRAVNSAGSGTATGTTQGTPAAPSSPTISGAATATAFITTYGTASDPQSFSITGSALTADIIATAPTGFEVSNDGTTYGSTATFTQGGGSASGTLRIRLTATAAVSGSYDNQNIVLSSTGASSVNITSASSGNAVAQKALSIITATVASKVYDRSTASGTVTSGTLSGFVGSETVVVSSAIGSYADWNVGTGKTATITYTLGNGTNGGLANNYSLANTSSTGDITTKALTVTSPVVTSKTYDGTTSANITGTLSGVISPDAVTLIGTGTFASADVGTGISVTSSSTLGGADAANYTLTQPIGLTGNITAASQTITFASLTPVLLSTADYSPGATASSGLTVTYTSSNQCVATIVGGNIHIIGAGTTTITASQSGGGNYGAATSVNQTLTVMNPISTLAAGDVVVIAYNTGSPDNFAILFTVDVAAGTVFYVNDNELASTSSTSFTDLSEGEASFTVKAGQTIAAGTVIVLPWGAAAVSATQYDWSSTTGAGLGGSNDELYIYTASSITATSPTVFISYAKIGTSPSAIPSSLTLGTTAIAPSAAALRYATSGATYSGTKATILTAIGNTATNWNSTGATTFAASDWTFSVSPSPLITSSGTLSAVNTTYGTASASPTSFSVSSSNLTADLTLTAPSGFEISSGSSYATSLTISPDACGAIASASIDVRLAASTAVGTYSGNIALSSTGATTVNVATVSSTVSTKTLTITNLSASDKLYDGLSTVTVSGTLAYSGLENSESFSVTGTVSWAFPNATVENNKTLTRTGNYSAPSANYTVTQPSLTASITTRSLTITANDVNKAYGDVLTDGSGSTAFTSSGLQNSEAIGSVTISYGNGALAGDAVGTYTSQVTPSAATGGTFTASNYSISYVAGNIIVSSVPTLNPVTLTSALSTTYGSASSGVSFVASGSNLSTNITVTAQSGYQVSNDNASFVSSVSVANGTMVYVQFTATQSVGTYNNATAVVLSSTGATSVNVTISSSGNIVTAKALTISGISISNKVYDGNATATISGIAAYSDLVNGESFAVSGTPSAVFNNKNAGTTKPISVSGYTAPSSNYSITQPTGLTADITVKALTVTSPAVTTKTYDGNTNATITGTLSGVESGDVVTLTGTGTFASANVGTGISVTSTSTLGGADAGNYSLTQPTGLTGEITKANQTITFGALPNKSSADVPFNLTATASSGLTVSYTSSDTTVASIVGNTVTIVGVGTMTISASQSGNSNNNAASNVTQTLTVTLADIEEIIFPQYIQGVNGTNSNRIPSAYYLKLNNLNPNTTYRFYGGFVTATDLSTSSGAGNNIYVNYSGGSFTRSSSPSLATAGNYGTLTTNANGSYTGWFVMEPTGNAARFVPGTNLFLKVSLNDGNNGTTVVNYRTSANTLKVINLVASAGANNGTGLYGTSAASAKSFAVLYDNINGTGRPISASFIEDDGTANTTANSYSSFYNTNVNGISGAYGVVIPNNNSNGVKRIEFKKTSDNSLIYSVTDNDGNWSGSANTVNPTGGTTAISIPNATFDDATYNESLGISLLQNTKINGTLTLSQGTLTVGPYELTLNNNIARTTGLIDASNSSATIIFSGTSAQSIPASTFTGNINNLTLSNSAGLSISQDLSVVGALTLSSGKLTLGTNHLTLGESATITGTFSSNNMIISTGLGELRKRFAQGSGDIASFTFPVGNAGSVAEYTPIVLDFASGNYGANAYVSVRVQDSKQGTLNSSVTNYLNRNWIVEPNDITGFSYKIQLHYVDADFVTDGTMAEGDLKPIKISSGQWYQPTDGSFTNALSQGSAGVFANSNYLEWNGLTTFSEFGGAGGSNQPLPVELLSFTAECGQETILLKWQTASEFNSAYFEIQKSLDGITWNTIGNQTAAGNSTELLSYSFEDASKSANTYYYRLNQVDNDGLQKFYGPISPLCESIIHLNGKTIPNPSNNEFWLQISSAEQQKFTYVLQDVNGSKIMENSADLLPGSNLFPIRETIPSGMYFILLQTENGRQQVIKHIRN